MAFKGLALSGGVALGTFLALNPYTLLHFDAFWSDFSYEREHMALGHFGQDRDISAFESYARTLGRATGVFGLAALYGLVTAFRERDRVLLIMYGWVGMYLLVVSTWEMRGERYLLPIVWTLLLLGARTLLRQAMLRRRIIVLAAALFLYLPIQALALSSHYEGVSTPDTRQRVTKWVQGEVAPGSLIALEHYTYHLTTGEHHLLRLPLDVVQPERFSGFYNPRWYENFDYVLISSSVYLRYRREPERFPEHLAFYAHLEDQWREVQRFHPGSSPGPEIIAYVNPRSERPDQPFSIELYQSLEGIEIDLIMKFLGGLEAVLASGGYYERSRSLGATAAHIERLHRKR